MGALEPRKAPEVLGRAFATARARGLDADLVVAGSGRLAGAIAGPGVHLVGAVDDARLKALYAHALALVMPSWLEGFGLPPLEAAAHGVPAVVTDLPGLPRDARDRRAVRRARGRGRAGGRAAARRRRARAARRPRRRRRASGAPMTWERAADALHAALAGAAGGGDVSFSAVVVLHDSAGDVAVLLDSLREHVLPHGDVQVVCVDSGSSDDGADVAAARGAEVVRLDGNPGFGAANNAGVAHARHDVDRPAQPRRDRARRRAARLAALAAARDALHVPRLLNADGSVQRSAHPVPGRVSALLPAVVPSAPPAARPAGDRRPVARRDASARWAGRSPRCSPAAPRRCGRSGPSTRRRSCSTRIWSSASGARPAGVPTILHPALRLVHAGQHSTGPALGTAHELQARRRREVVRAALGPRALALDDAAQAVTFATRAVARAVVRRDGSRPRAQLAALRAARR